MEFELGGKRPTVHPDAYIAPTAVLIGDVEVGANASVWFGAVLRADEALIRIGDGANVQDNAVIHCAKNLPTLIEPNASVGHSAQLEGCIVEEGAVVGMGATMLQRSRLGAGSLLAAGAVLGEGSEVPPGHLAAGVPAIVKKPLDGSSGNWVGITAQHYRDRAVAYREKLRPAGR
ncbi:MAG: gamma carbonic anhydrase family protein [Chloroflexi bacterium]|nr:MAG: gamma carbonic anhydrase family protein [Chloroflexota bacterium]TMC72413.1 MAG: gamma carbonic anhydrase family protein [Chloroflexota bacterium]